MNTDPRMRRDPPTWEPDTKNETSACPQSECIRDFQPFPTAMLGVLCKSVWSDCQCLNREAVHVHLNAQNSQSAEGGTRERLRKDRVSSRFKILMICDSTEGTVTDF
ncbi:hypothetical protein Y032_0174g439 [Ancylostoma ceylanicum]|uniref:Uncharacterized protein n=1 Tax=Ancylostoma ceylanicum TaxID=53326 RepID=A0A016STZ7_9BILA|nr:hypothetical protein Y032_0174g439 [Ancylostoma ceylanicum]